MLKLVGYRYKNSWSINSVGSLIWRACIGVHLNLLVFLVHDYLVHPLIKKLILRKSVDHSPPLFTQFSHCLKHWHLVFFVDNFLENCHRDKCAGPSHSCATMYDWRLSFFEVFQKLFNHVIECFFAWRKRSIAIRPAGDLVMSDDSFEISIGVFDIYFPNSELLLFYLA